MARTMRCSSSTIRMRSRSLLIRNPATGVDRKFDGDDRATVRGVFCTDRTAVLINNPLHDAQTKSGPAAPLGVERLEDARQIGIDEARSKIANGADDETGIF